MVRTIAAPSLYERLRLQDEIALLDIREAGEFGQGHLLVAVNVPLSILEAAIHGRVPRRGTPVVLVDGADDGRAHHAARRLAALGYGDVSVLEGGTRGWTAAGYALFEGVNVPTKAFAEAVLEHDQTPDITAAEFEALRTSGRTFTLLDGRTEAEHAVRCIPGSISMPNGELLLHVGDVISQGEPEAPVIVHCAGRTRSIIGAQTLRAAGLSAPVYALRGGTQEWTISGLELERGSARRSPPLGAAGQDLGAHLTQNLLAQNAGLSIDHAAFEAWRADEDRTLYVFDVRTQAEYEAGHFPGAVHAPAGQLVHAVDNWVGTWGARIALLDTAPFARAVMAAYWLRRQGWEAGAVVAPEAERWSERGGGPRRSVPIAAARIAVEDLARLGPEVLIFDTGSSADFRHHHLPEATWLSRPTLPAVLADRILTSALPIVVYADDDEDPRADLVASDLVAAAPERDVRVLAGGRAAWRAAGMNLVASPDEPSDDKAIDTLFWLHDRHTGNTIAARAYLDWELSLVNRIQSDGTLAFAL